MYMARHENGLMKKFFFLSLSRKKVCSLYFYDTKIYDTLAIGCN